MSKLTKIVCIEKNPAYAAAGRKVLPEARWIEGDVFDLPKDLGHFDCAISNPPFGSTAREGRGAPRYSGGKFEYHVIDVASDLADYGTFIIPQMSAPFRYSGRHNYERAEDQHYAEFRAKTGIDLGHSCGIDTSIYLKDWRGVAPPTEIVTCDFMQARDVRKPAQRDMFAEAAE